MNPLYLTFPAIAGFLVSFYIYISKRYNKPMYCILGENCDAVVKSKYGKTFGVENTVPGMVYYVLVFAYAAALVINRNVFKQDIVYYFIVIASIGSVLFSIYLAAVQAFVLKKWCEYCIVSSVASVVILVLLVI